MKSILLGKEIYFYRLGVLERGTIIAINPKRYFCIGWTERDAPGYSYIAYNGVPYPHNDYGLLTWKDIDKYNYFYRITADPVYSIDGISEKQLCCIKKRMSN